MLLGVGTSTSGHITISTACSVVVAVVFLFIPLIALGNKRKCLAGGAQKERYTVAGDAFTRCLDGWMDGKVTEGKNRTYGSCLLALLQLIAIQIRVASVLLLLLRRLLVFLLQRQSTG